MLKKGPIPNHLYLQSEVHMGACQKANVSNIELSQKKDQFWKLCVIFGVECVKLTAFSYFKLVDVGALSLYK